MQYIPSVLIALGLEQNIHLSTVHWYSSSPLQLSNQIWLLKFKTRTYLHITVQWTNSLGSDPGARKHCALNAVECTFHPSVKCVQTYTFLWVLSLMCSGSRLPMSAEILITHTLQMYSNYQQSVLEILTQVLSAVWEASLHGQHFVKQVWMITWFDIKSEGEVKFGLWIDAIWNRR